MRFVPLAEALAELMADKFKKSDPSTVETAFREVFRAEPKDHVEDFAEWSGMYLAAISKRKGGR
jgi:hypothetical protein